MQAKVLAAAALAAALGGCARSQWQTIVDEFAQLSEFMMPIEPSGLLALQAGGRLSDMPPVYMTIQHKGQSLLVRPAYTESEAPEGANMSISLMAFLRAAADDPKAAGIALNPGKTRISIVLEKEEVLRLIAALKERGFTEPPPAPPRPAAPVLEFAVPPPLTPESKPVMEPGTWLVRLIALPENHKIATIKVIREFTGLGLADAKALTDNLPSVLVRGISQADAYRMKHALEPLGVTVELRNAAP